MKLNRLAKYAWGVLVFNLLVILWGAYVRATGSGAGCGRHWPLCNGEVIPRSSQVATLIEFTHRLTSGIAFLLVVGLLIWALRVYSKGDIVLTAAWFSMAFIITEALIGASLVIFEWVADDTSIGRTISISVHLVNTFLLLGSLTMTAWWSSGGKPISLKGHKGVAWGVGFGLLGVLLLGVTGAITALGDTLFPANTLAEGLQQDFSTTAHFLIRLRVWHPLIAIGVGFYVIFIAGILGLLRSDQWIKRFALTLVVLFIVQMGVGITNIILLAPIPVQLVHLLIADLIWITLVLFSATILTPDQVSVNEHTSDQPVLYAESRSTT